MWLGWPFQTSEVIFIVQRIVAVDQLIKTDISFVSDFA